MNRRDFITLLGGVAAWPLAARAQQRDRVRRIGVLMGDETDPFKTWVSAFIQALAGLGWTEGRNVRMDLRWFGDDTNRIRALAQELVGLQPDIILASSTPVTVAVQRATRTIPIVFANVGDPVASGIVARLDRPGGNVTGFGILEASLGGKWLELLSEIAPGLKRAAIPQDRHGARPCGAAIDSAPRRRGDRVRRRVPTHDPADRLDEAKAAFRVAWERQCPPGGGGDRDSAVQQPIWQPPRAWTVLFCLDRFPRKGGPDEHSSSTARIHRRAWRRDGMAVRGARAAAGHAGDRIP
jgi:ABC-type sugar transport system substrate-binding protein